MTFVDDVDLDTYCGRVGNLYVRNGLSPPFGLYHAAQGWMARGIPLSHCIDVIERYFAGYGRSCSSGSGDRNFAWLSELIETKWHDQSFARPPQRAPKQSRHHGWQVGDEERNQTPRRRLDFTTKAPNLFSMPVSFAPDRLRLGQKAAGAFSPAEGTKSASPQQDPQTQRGAFRFSRGWSPPIPTKIDLAVTWLRAELANGERVAAEVEAKALSVGIAPRTYDRARQRLGVISRRIGFGRGAKYTMALPVIHETPSGGANDVSAI